MLNPDRWLLDEADRYLMRERRALEAEDEAGYDETGYTDAKFHHLLETNPHALKAWERVSRGLPPQELACDFCPSQDAKEFDGVAACKSCVDGLRICRECGETEFVDGPEGPTMCVWCRSVDSDYSPDCEDN